MSPSPFPLHAQPAQDYSNGYYTQWIIMHWDNSGLVVHELPSLLLGYYIKYEWS